MFLPHDLIILILLRLPVKSLIRFKYVRKSWFSLISHDSHFANSHFELTSITANRRILFISTPTHESLSIDFEASLSTPTHEPLSIDFEASPDDDTASVSLNLDSIFLDDFSCYEIKGSCRGFILLCSSLNIYLWNPSTGVHKQIPLSPFGSNFYAHYFYGFGYDHSTDDYLVVSMSHHNYHDTDDTSLHLEYFSVKANIWKEVEATPFPYADRYIFEHNPKGGTLYKGAIHWLAYRDDTPTDVIEVIVAFNLMERKLSYMHLPSDCYGSPLHSGLWVYGEFLSVYTRNYSNDTVEIWVMKEYKVSSSWTMTLVLPLDPIPNEVYFCRLLCCTKSGDIIGTYDDDGLVKYDKNGQFLEQHSYSGYVRISKVTMHIDSLLSLPSDGDNQQT